MDDIDSDDEDPQIICKMKDVGIQFNVLNGVNRFTYMKILYNIHNVGLKERKPNLYKFIMKKIQKLMEETSPEEENRDDEFVPLFFLDLMGQKIEDQSNLNMTAP